MICRMNKKQRDSLIELIEAIVMDKRGDGDLHESLRRLEAEKDFHEAFKNESSEDDHNHVG